MKQELEKLGFRDCVNWFKLELNEERRFIEVDNLKNVSIWSYDEYIFLFKYNHEKLKQLIEILK